MDLRSALPTIFVGLCIAGTSCGGPTGPDQSIVAPAGWTITEHAHGDLHFSRWSLATSDNVTAQLSSFVIQGAPVDTVEKLDAWKNYITGNAQNSLFLARTWTIGKYSITRFFSFSKDTDSEHGVASIWLHSSSRDYALSISKKGMKREALTYLADKAAEDFAKAN